MSEANKALLRRYGEELWNHRNLAVADELLAPTILTHLSGLPTTTELEKLKQDVILLHAGFPDIQIVLEDLMVEGDKVVGRWTFRGTHTGEYRGIPPTGKSVTWTTTAIYRIASGKIVEVWGDTDRLGMLQQLGVVAH